MKRTPLWTALLLLGTASAAVAHGASMKANAESAAAGGALVLTGTDFHADAVIRLALIGVLDEYELVEVTADTAGGFSHEIEIPAGVRPGQYRLVAFSAEGDEEAALDLSITAASTHEQMVPESMAEHGDEAPMATVAEISIERSYSSAGWGVIGGIIGLAAGLGLGLTRRRNRAA